MRKGLVYVTGGARSGKSTFAEGLMMEQGHRILYIATAVPFDNEMRDRIKKHRQERPSFWRTLEAYKGIGKSLEDRGERFHGILLDCVTVMITNLMMDMGFDEEGLPRKDSPDGGTGDGGGGFRDLENKEMGRFGRNSIQ